jgi:hypothetical protein
MRIDDRSDRLDAYEAVRRVPRFVAVNAKPSDASGDPAVTLLLQCNG